MVSVRRNGCFLPGVFKTAHLWLHFHRKRQIWLWFHGLLLIVSSEVMTLLTFGCFRGEFFAVAPSLRLLLFSLALRFQTQSLYSVHRTPVSAWMRLQAERSRWDECELQDGLLSGRTCGMSSGEVWKKKNTHSKWFILIYNSWLSTDVG